MNRKLFNDGNVIHTWSHNVLDDAQTQVAKAEVEKHTTNQEKLDPRFQKNAMER